ncbi:MAG: hypothetical protein PHU62_00545 [Bacteroidales bacterium]|jgi:hypothetical protein|nr:hypothetical protein [Bacteroidales bacterium]MDD2203842.1 hypothetical protein [Bacteroidales bacterium]MDD3152816.1 hypothetical protein [Bacteroidales bacterium]MDD3913142.1 hypothetical protein [Bacteroidales bacterium]MDD4633057.1 hypothetical protein [Bacteroidales bacterium]
MKTLILIILILYLIYFVLKRFVLPAIIKHNIKKQDKYYSKNNDISTKGHKIKLKRTHNKPIQSDFGEQVDYEELSKHNEN